MKYDPQFIADVLGVPVAKGFDNIWRWYRNKPALAGNMFIDATGEQGTLPDCIAYSGDWKDSVRLPGFGIALPDNAVILQQAEDFRFRFANRLDSYLKQGYQLIGDVVEKKGKFYRAVVKLSCPPICPLTGYRVVKASEADTMLPAGWKVASLPFYRSDGELVVELIQR